MAAILSLQCFTALTFTSNLPFRRQIFGISPATLMDESSTALFAKKKDAKLAALEALKSLEETLDVAKPGKDVTDLLQEEPLSKKELMELQKKQKKLQKKQATTAQQEHADSQQPAAGKKKMSKKEEMLAKALELEDSWKPEPETGAEKPLSKKEQTLMKALEMDELDNAASTNGAVSDEPKLSKKELKALKKKEEQLAAKQAEKLKKKEEKQQEMESVNGVNGHAATNGESGVRRGCSNIQKTSSTAEELTCVYFLLHGGIKQKILTTNRL